MAWISDCAKVAREGLAVMVNDNLDILGRQFRGEGNPDSNKAQTTGFRARAAV